MSVSPQVSRRFPRRAALAAALLLLAAQVGAQGRTTGTLEGRIMDERGSAVPDAAVTLSRGDEVVRIALADPTGRFRIEGLRPGRYALLAEQVGYQPLRLTGVPVVAGVVASVSVEVVRRPPPIDRVDERPYRGAGAAPATEVLYREAIDAPRGDVGVAGLALAAPWAVGHDDARQRAPLSVNGLAAGDARLVVDGFEELLLRHPGFPGEGATIPAFSRAGIGQARVQRFTLDAELPAAPGGMLDLVSRWGGARTAFAPAAWWSSSTLGTAAEDNPADSSASSFSGNLVASGPIRGDSGGWAISAGYHQIATPSAAPFSRDGIGEAIAAAADPREVTGWTSPVMRRWTGANGNAQVAVPLGRNGRLEGRLGFASWDEEAPLIAASLANGSGGLLEASDASGAIALEFFGEDWRSITRLGLATASRDWTATGVPYTIVATDGAAIGVHPAFPGAFEDRRLTLGQTLIAPAGDHVLSAGGTLGLRRATHDWLPHGRATAAFGTADDLGAGIGTWVSTASAGSAEELSITEYSVFLQDTWQAAATLRVQFGFRFEGQSLPDDVVSADADVAAAFGITNTFVPNDRSSSVSPRLGVTWDPSGTGRTSVHLAAGLSPGRYAFAALAEFARHDGGVELGRAAGLIGWPAEPTDLVLGKAITFFDTDVRAPRAIHVTGSVTHAVAPGTVLSVGGGFQHTDYLLRREDVNRPPAPLAFTDEGRPVWGALEQFGGLIVPVPGSNLRVDGFDHVWGLVSTGYAEQQYATAALEHRAAGGLTVAAGYTWSRTEDNLPNQLSPLPVDRALVLDATAGATDWGDGRSDLDVPHRLVVSAGYQSPGDGGFAGFARWRWRSGLPFTPGFPPGVDVNGDGSSSNDPVALRAVDGVTGLLGAAGCDVGNNAFAVRNSCREAAAHALDAGVSARLPLGGRHRVVLVVNAFNVVASASGVVDRAAVLVDPEGTITTDGEGRLVLPLVPNDHFGQLLSRRAAPRTVRLGLRVEY